MGNRGQKRVELAEELPADKRVCNSVESRPGSSAQNSDGDMDTSNSMSISSNAESDSPNESCDSESSGVTANRTRRTLRDYQRSQSSNDQAKVNAILSTLSQEISDNSDDILGTVAALTELCEVLCLCNEDSVSTMLVDSLSPILVKLAKHESSPDIMLLAIRAITHLCYIFPRAAGFLARHDAVPALCQRLLTIEYLDVAEECLQALEKISHDQPLACLQSGAVMAALNYIDFFSTSVQRRALSIAVNICKKLPSECPSSLMEAVPVFCNLLQYEDQPIIETAAACLMKIADRVRHSPEMLDDLCKHGLIPQLMQLIQSNSRFTQSPSYSSLISLLVKLASGSFIAFKTLHELNISSLLKDILSSYDMSHGMSLPSSSYGRPNQVHEVLKLLNELLPSVARDQNTQLVSEKESFLVNQPDLLMKFEMDVLPNLMQVLNSGANLYVCYGCLSIINKTIYFSKSDLLVELFKDTNIPSVLAGILTRKDHHLLMLALQILEAMLQKFSNHFINLFVKEGVFFAVDMLLKSDIGSSVNFLINSDQKSSGKEGLICLCYAFGNDQPSSTGPCKLEKDCVHNLANHIRTNYIEVGSCESGNRSSNTLEELKNFSAILSELMNMSGDCANDSAEIEYNLTCIVEELLQKICGAGDEPVSTFEFVESNIVKSLLDFLSSGMYSSKIREQHGKASDFHSMEKQLKRFARLSLFLSHQLLDVSSLLVFIRKLQSALSSVENFPVVLSNVSKLKNSYATVPNGGYVPHPCLRVCFVKRKGETGLSDYSNDYVTVDPFSSLDAIEGFLWCKVGAVPTVHTQSAQATVQAVNLPSNATSAEENLPEPMDSDTPTSVDVAELQVLIRINETQSEVAANSCQTIVTTTNDDDISTASAKLEMPCSSGSYISEKENSTSCSNNHHFPKLELYLDGEKLDRARNLYQAIILRQMKADNELVTSSKFWTQQHKIEYGKASNCKDSCLDVHSLEPPSSCLSNIPGTDRHCAAFIYGIFDTVLGFELDGSSATYDILVLLKSLEAMNRFRFHLVSSERITSFSEGRIDTLENLQIAIPSVPQSEFVSGKLTEKLEQQMRDPLAVSVGGMPSWCNELIASCPFLIGFDTRCKYFRLAAFSSLRVEPHSVAPPASGSSGERRGLSDIMPRKKFLVDRDHILDSATKIMEVHVHDKSILEVEYKEEVGTGLGPTVEFFTLVSHEFQKSGLGMWRSSSDTMQDLQAEMSGGVDPRYGLFPRPWSSSLDASNKTLFSDVMKKFVLLGQIVAKALHDGRVLDLPLSRAFYKLVLGQRLSLYDIHLFDPELGRALLEFKALVDKKRVSDLACGGTPTFELNSCSQYTKIEDLCLDFTLPGYPGYTLSSEPDYKMVNMNNLEEYVSLIVDATLNTGIARQVEAFKSGFNQVFPIEHLHVFNEEELEHLLCGEQDPCKSNELLDHIKFDHGYTASSPPILSLLEIIQEFEPKERRAFVQFITGAPRLPLGGLASLTPKLTIVRKHSDNRVEDELPSVMTCANYLKLPPYSSKEMMKEKLLYAITEGQGSFHLS